MLSSTITSYLVKRGKI